MCTTPVASSNPTLHAITLLVVSPTGQTACAAQLNPDGSVPRKRSTPDLGQGALPNLNRIPLNPNEPWTQLQSLTPCHYQTILDLQQHILTSPKLTQTNHTKNDFSWQQCYSLFFISVDNNWLTPPAIHELLHQNTIDNNKLPRWHYALQGGQHPGRRRHLCRHYRRPRGVQQFRNYLHSYPEEGEPTPAFPSVYLCPAYRWAWEDETPIYYSRSWKKHRRTQYKT